MDFSFVFLLFFMLVQLLLIFNPRVVLLNVLFGLFGVVLAGLCLGNVVAWSIPLHPWFELLLGFMSVVTVLVSVRDI